MPFMPTSVFFYLFINCITLTVLKYLHLYHNVCQQFLLFILKSLPHKFHNVCQQYTITSR